MKRHIGLFLWVLLHMGLAIWTHDLVLGNKETLFLTGEGQRDYARFRELVSERRVLATKVEYDSPVDEGRYQRMRDAAARLRREFPEPRYQWLDFNSTYERKLGDQSFATVAKFA